MNRLWRAMQFVEANRHHAERLERQSAEAASPIHAQLLHEVATQRREIAELVAAVVLGGRTSAATPPGYHQEADWLRELLAVE